MKIDRDNYSLWSLYLLIGTGALAVVWEYFKWPARNAVKALPVLFAVNSFTASYFGKRERQNKWRLREEIRGLSDDLTLNGDFTVDDFDLLYDVEELKQIVSVLKAMPERQRKLQTAVDKVENQTDGVGTCES